jgi:signal transduction protein with GAF and PtsI domain
MAKGKRKENVSVSPTALATINEIVAICGQEGPAEGTFKRVLARLKRIIAFDAATVYLCEPRTGQLQPAASLDGPVAILEFLTIENGEGLTGWAADHGKPILLADRSNHHDFDPDTDFASFMSVPLIQCQRTIGVLNLGSKTPGAFCEHDASILSMVASQVALSLENLRYEAELADLHALIDNLQEQVRQSKTQPASFIDPADLKDFVAKINHDTNNALAILLGNVQCMLMDKSVTDQNTVSRLRRMERALIKVNEANHRLLELVKITARQDGASTAGESRDGKVLTKNV